MQIKLAPEGQKKFVRRTHCGVRLQTRLSYGITPGYFQEAIDQLTSDIQRVAAYMDDILVGGATAEEHVQTLPSLLQRLYKTKAYAVIQRVFIRPAMDGMPGPSDVTRWLYQGAQGGHYPRTQARKAAKSQRRKRSRLVTKMTHHYTVEYLAIPLVLRAQVRQAAMLCAATCHQSLDSRGPLSKQPVHGLRFRIQREARYIAPGSLFTIQTRSNSFIVN